MADITYQFEYPAAERVRVGFIGCGGHSFRNVYPTFQYAPVELIATCDQQADRAAAYARQFGAARWYADHRELLADPELEAVFIVTNYDEHGHPRATALAREALEAGRHVWMEKPPAASVAEIEDLQAVSERTGRFVMVGFKKMFFPTIERAKAILSLPEFGPVSSVTCRYPQSLPENTADDRAMQGFLDHLVHPGSILQYLCGPVAELIWLRTPVTGATVATLRFVNGAVGSLHLAAGQSGTSPLERLEIVGRGSNLVVENSVKLTWYRPGGRGAYGRSDSFLAPVEQAPLVWEPEFSLGQLYNKGLFMLGYVGEVRHFCACVRAGTPPARAGLTDALAILKLYEAYRQPEGTRIRLA